MKKHLKTNPHPKQSRANKLMKHKPSWAQATVDFFGLKERRWQEMSSWVRFSLHHPAHCVLGQKMKMAPIVLLDCVLVALVPKRRESANITASLANQARSRISDPTTSPPPSQALPPRTPPAPPLPHHHPPALPLFLMRTCKSLC